MRSEFRAGWVYWPGCRGTPTTRSSSLSSPRPGCWSSGSHGSRPVPAGQDNTSRHPAAHGRLAVTIATPGKLTSYDSPLHLPWLWGRCPLQLGGLPATQGQPTKCPAVGQACWNRAKAGHLLTPRNLRLGILSLCPEFQLSGQQLSDYDSGLGLNSPHSLRQLSL